MNMTLDIVTTFRISAWLYPLMALATWLMLFRTAKTTVKVWCLAGLLSGVSVFLITLRGVISDVWTYPIAQPMLMAAYLTYAQALRLDVGRAWRWRSMALVVLVYALVIVVGYEYRQHWGMAVLVRCVNSLSLLALTLAAIALGRVERSRNAYIIAAGFGMFTLCMFANALVTWYARGSLQDLQQQLLSHVMGLMSIFTLLITHMGFLGLTLERLQRVNLQLRQVQLHAQQWREHSRALTLLDRQRTLAVLSNSLGHGIIQPLTATRVNLQMAKLMVQSDKGDKAQVQDVLQRVVAGLQRSSVMVEHIRRFLRPVAAQASAFTLQSVIQDAHNLLRQELIYRSIELEVKWPPEPVRVHAESLPLTQALVHVLRNAMQVVKASQSRRITLTLTHDRHQGCIEITDSGPGLPPEVLKQKIHGLNPVTDWTAGLGLYMTSGILAECGGLLQLENSETGGARVSLLVPLVR